MSLAKQTLYVCSVIQSFQLFGTPWTVAHQAPLSMEFSRQEYWSGLPFTTPGNLPDPEIEPASSASPALADGVSQKDKEHYSILTHIYGV